MELNCRDVCSTEVTHPSRCRGREICCSVLTPCTWMDDSSRGILWISKGMVEFEFNTNQPFLQHSSLPCHVETSVSFAVSLMPTFVLSYCQRKVGSTEWTCNFCGHLRRLWKIWMRYLYLKKYVGPQVLLISGGFRLLPVFLLMDVDLLDKGMGSYFTYCLYLQ